MPGLQVRSPQELTIELDDGQHSLRRILSRPAHDPYYLAVEN